MTPSRVSGIEPGPGVWDFDGEWAPRPGKQYSIGTAFSVGIFQWLPKAKGKGLKRGKVVKRIHGYTSNPHHAYERARWWIKAHCASSESR